MANLDDARQSSPDADIFEFVYEGPDVDGGTMSAREVAEVVAGLTRAFSTVSDERDLGDQYEVRLKDVDHSSFHLIFEAVTFAKANPAAATAISAGAAVLLNAVSNVTSGAYKVITDIGVMLEAKKTLKGQRMATLPTVFSDGEIEVSAPEGLIVLTKEQYELLLSQRVDRQFSQIVSPLKPERVERFQMRRSNVDLASVDAGQRTYFDHQEITEEKTKEGTEITGTLNSLTKTNLRGTFYTSDGIHVPYRYVGNDINLLFRGFSVREPLKVLGRIRYGSDGIPTSVEVQDIEFLQRNLIGR